MPRVENLGPNVHAWCEETHEGSSIRDVCTDCYADLQADPHAHDDELKPYGLGEPQGTEGWGGAVEHPPYEDELPYVVHRCDVCRVRLGEADN